MKRKKQAPPSDKNCAGCGRSIRECGSLQRISGSDIVDGYYCDKCKESVLGK